MADAALAFLPAGQDEAGLAGLAMASVAARLGCTKMALYRYVDAKEDFHTLMLDAALGPAPELPVEDWRAAAAAWADAMLVRLAAHPWAVDLPIGSALLTRNQRWWLEVLLRALRPSGLTLPERLSVTLLLSSHALATARMRRDRGAAGDGTTEPAAAFAALAAAPAAAVGPVVVTCLCGDKLSGRFGAAPCPAMRGWDACSAEPHHRVGPRQA